MNILRYSLLGFAALAASFSGINAKVTLSGVYEGFDKNDQGETRQLYMILDFEKGTPDFTQIFTTKESEFKMLPKDFMNAKKLNKAFAGTTAPGFAKFRDKVLFIANSEEVKITNPRSKRGIIICDWTNPRGETGKFAIIPLDNNAITTYGLTSFDQKISPNGLRLELVKSTTTNGKPGGLAPLSGKALEEAKEKLTSDYPAFIEQLDRLPDDPEESVTTPAPTEKAPATDSPKRKLPKLWSNDDNAPEPVGFRYHIRAKGGDYGYFETVSHLDFWDDKDQKGCDVACREFTNCTYENGRIYEEEYIYYGKLHDDHITFYYRMDSMNGGETEKIEPITLKVAPNGRDLIFHDWTFKRDK